MAISINNKRLFIFWALVSGVFFFPPQAHAAIIKPANNLGLAAYWSFNEGMGSSVSDYSGHGNAGTTSASWVPGKLGAALDYNGTTGFTTGLASSLGNPGAAADLTISAWVKLDSVSGLISIFTKGQSGTCFGYGIAINNGDLRARNSFGNFSAGAPAVTAGAWHHLVVVYTALGANAYVDGVAGTLNASGTTGSCASSGWAIGARAFNSNATELADGIIDEVRVYNRALGATEIGYLYQTGSSRYNSQTQTGANGSTLNSGLVARWTFDGADVTDKVYDRVGGNNGYFYSSATSTAKAVGKLGQALLLNGTTNHVSGSDASLPSGSAARTISVWIKPTTLPSTGTFGCVFSYGTASTAHAFGIGLVNSSGTQAVRFFGWGADLDGTYTASLTQWTHLVGVYDGTTAYIYVNGSLVTSHIESWNTTLSHFDIGRDPNGNQYFNGAVDDVRLYNRALSASEVKQLFGQGGGKINASGATLQNGTSLASGLMGYWSFNGADVTDKVYDRSGQGNNGYFFNGATSTAKVQGKLGQALNFDGVDDDVLVPSASALNPGTGSFTLAAWIKEDAFINGEAILLKTNGGGASSSYGFHFGVFNSNQPMVHFATAGSSLTQVRSNVGITTGKWYHVVMVIDRSNLSNSQAYINGAAVSTTVTDDGTNTGSITNTLPLAIGSESDNQSNFDGQIDEARYYNRVLTANEVKALYNLGK